MCIKAYLMSKREIFNFVGLEYARTQNAKHKKKELGRYLTIIVCCLVVVLLGIEFL